MSPLWLCTEICVTHYLFRHRMCQENVHRGLNTGSTIKHNTGLSWKTVETHWEGGGEERARRYPAAWSRPPWAPGWCLRCGAPGWKARRRLPPRCGSVQGRTPLTLEEKRERVEEVRRKRKSPMIRITICQNSQHISPSRADTGFCSGSELVSSSWNVFFFYWSGSPAVCLFIFKNNSPSQFWVWRHQRYSSKRPLWKSFPLPGVSQTTAHASLSVRPTEGKRLRVLTHQLLRGGVSIWFIIFLLFSTSFSPSLGGVCDWGRDLEPVKGSFIKA